MKIIKPPSQALLNPVFVVTCATCMCEFEYEKKDIHDDQRDGAYVKCPGCNAYIDHKRGVRRG